MKLLDDLFENRWVRYQEVERKVSPYQRPNQVMHFRAFIFLGATRSMAQPSAKGGT